MRRALFLLLFPLWTLAQTPDETDRAFQARQWQVAAAGYEKRVAATPDDGQAWYRLGVARHGLRDFRGALEAYAAARKTSFANPVQLHLGEARAHAQLGAADAAFAALTEAARSGFARSDLLYADDEILPLRGDARFQSVVDAVRKNLNACGSPEHRQFDFWLGEWDVEVQGQKTARSSIQLILGECVIYENYMHQAGYEGKSFSLYDTSSKAWEQRYVDSTGRLSSWNGGLLPDGRMQYLSTATIRGTKTTQRMTYTKEGPDRVRQTIEVSTDDGKSWTPNFDGLYIRRR